MRFMQSAELSFKLDQVQKMAATPSVAGGKAEKWVEKCRRALAENVLIASVPA